MQGTATYDLLREWVGWRALDAQHTTGNSPTVDTLRVDIPPIAGYVSQVGRISIVGTYANSASTGSIDVMDAAQLIYGDSWTMGSDKTIALEPPLVGTVSTTLSVVFAATGISSFFARVQYRRILEG